MNHHFSKEWCFWVGLLHIAAGCCAIVNWYLSPETMERFGYAVAIGFPISGLSFLLYSYIIAKKEKANAQTPPTSELTV